VITISLTARVLAAAIARNFEGLRLVAYQNAHDVPTIGYGHTNGVRIGDTCGQAEADAWLEDDMGAAVDAVGSLVKVPLTDHQQAALLDFTFNLGTGALASSTLLKDINAGNFEDVPHQLARWVHDHGGDVLPGLVRRRQYEATCWLTPDAPRAQV
jgi:lysozyme